MQVTTIGLDIAKNVFQVHGIDAAEKVVVWKQLRRSQVLALANKMARIAWAMLVKSGPVSGAATKEVHWSDWAYFAVFSHCKGTSRLSREGASSIG